VQRHCLAPAGTRLVETRSITACRLLRVLGSSHIGDAMPWYLRWPYDLLLYLALPLVWLRLIWRARRAPAYAERRPERLGRVPDGIPQGAIWFHSVSAGESIALAPLIEALIERFPAQPVLVTTMTPTGSAQVQRLLGGRVAHCYAPYDFGFAVERFLRRTRPRALVLMETELWPNLISRSKRHGLQVLVVNARLSARSARGYARAGGADARHLAPDRFDRLPVPGPSATLS
jgi:3-deoxy-D-manno-octulosonic-acid transferase